MLTCDFLVDIWFIGILMYVAPLSFTALVIGTTLKFKKT